MVVTKEQIAAVKKKYNQSPKGIKCQRISNWKMRGIISEDWDKTYDWYIGTLNCENPECNVILTTSKIRSNTTKCLDHDHNIIDSSNIRNVLCLRCNLNDRSTNTSGVPNVDRHQYGWKYRRSYNGKRHCKNFITKEEACAYKIEFELIMRDS